MKTIVALLAALAAVSGFAQSPVVEGVQSPAWIERAGGREPLAVGMQLGNRDRIVSGPNARVLLRMPEGSLVKLGEQGQLTLDQLAARREAKKNVVTASLDVLQGAFRFTTQVASRFRGERDISIRIATVTAGIRGTDVWGKAAEDRDIVCLIEGRISVQRAGDAPFQMDQPLSFYIAPRNAPALPIAPVAQSQLETWAQETEIQPGQGGARRGGQWRVTLARAANQQAALAVYDAVREAGYPAELRPIRAADGSTVYRVRIANLPSRAEAQALGTRLQGIAGVTEASVSRG